MQQPTCTSAAAYGNRSQTCFPDFTEDLGRVEHAGCDVVLMLPGWALEVHDIKLQVTTQLGICKLQLTQTHTSTCLYCIPC